MEQLRAEGVVALRSSGAEKPVNREIFSEIGNTGFKLSL